MFYTRSAELYAQVGAKIGMVLPHSALRSGQHLVATQDIQSRELILRTLAGFFLVHNPVGTNFPSIGKIRPVPRALGTVSLVLFVTTSLDISPRLRGHRCWGDRPRAEARATVGKLIQRRSSETRSSTSLLHRRHGRNGRQSSIATEPVMSSLTAPTAWHHLPPDWCPIKKSPAANDGAGHAAGTGLPLSPMADRNSPSTAAFMDFSGVGHGVLWTLKVRQSRVSGFENHRPSAV